MCSLYRTWDESKTQWAERALHALLQKGSDEQALPRHAALLSNASSDKPASVHIATFVNHTEGRPASADGQQPSSLLQGVLPDSLTGNDASMGLQENVTSAIQQLLNSSHDDLEPSVDDKGDSRAGDITGNLDDTVYQTETQGLASLSKSKSKQSVPQIGAVDDQQESDRRFVSQQQMDESGHADAFAGIVNAIPDNIKDQLADNFKPASAVASPPAQEEKMPADSNTTHLDANSTQTSAMQRDDYAELWPMTMLAAPDHCGTRHNEVMQEHACRTWTKQFR